MSNMISLPFDSLNMGTVEEPIYDRAITIDEERRYNKALYFTGVNCMPEDGMKVTAIDGRLSLNVAAGLGCIEGTPFLLENDIEVELEAADEVNPRIDRVVIRQDIYGTRDVSVCVLKGEASKEPEPPTITREYGYFELASADALIRPGATSLVDADISDLRGTELCPFIVMSIPVSLDKYSF